MLTSFEFVNAWLQTRTKGEYGRGAVSTEVVIEPVYESADDVLDFYGIVEEIPGVEINDSF